MPSSLFPAGFSWRLSAGNGLMFNGRRQRNSIRPHWDERDVRVDGQTYSHTYTTLNANRKCGLKTGTRHTVTPIGVTFNRSLPEGEHTGPLGLNNNLESERNLLQPATKVTGVKPYSDHLLVMDKITKMMASLRTLELNTLCRETTARKQRPPTKLAKREKYTIFHLSLMEQKIESPAALREFYHPKAQWGLVRRMGHFQ